jgi:hypothetical protein
VTRFAEFSPIGRKFTLTIFLLQKDPKFLAMVKVV